ncbi:hypothetical protein [Shewanella ulleungensis]|uniref:Uncharacterized protein n=1 Tax=Shewanella ulleungensis TaxID=2282699 RepID=A0ABQ2QNJ1_9GAMM|nr:hypothetical protein [Shewanella ulleungensis]MCL1150344.1 hypothetical protein [Shewanella ulleungensis]GGP88229.1 hypothetical protein GCM10009410_22530 [Shewanella ulleungensis]
MEPKYENYSFEELLDVRKHIDKDAFPERSEKLEIEIKLRQSIPKRISTVDTVTIIDIEDTGVHLKIIKKTEDCFLFQLSITYNFIISYQKTWYEMEFSKLALLTLINDLREGNQSWHGNSNIWSANKIFIKKLNHPFHFRDVRLYRRWFILGFNIVPTSLSGNLLGVLYRVESE